MFKALLVDDERYSREGIFESIEPEKYGISEIKLSENGEEALVIAKSFLPDILITDIKMPKLNGIDLSREIKKICPDISIIFLSAYSDKEFYRSAIDINVVKYVEKPIENDELDSALRLAVSRRREIKNRQMHYENDIALELTLEKTAMVNQKQYEISRADIEKHIGVDYDSCFTVVLTSPNEVLFESVLYAYAIMDKIKTELYSRNHKYLTSYKDNNLIFHFFTKEAKDEKYCISIAETLYECVKSCFSRPDSLYLGLGRSVKDIGELHISYNDAVICVQKSFFFPEKHIFVNDFDEFPASFDDKLIDAFSAGLKSGDSEKTFKIIGDIRNLVLCGSPGSKQKALEVYLKLFFEIESVKAEIKKFEGSELPTETAASIMNTISSAADLDKLTGELRTSAEHFFYEVFGNKPMSPARAVKKIINECYGNPELSLGEIAKGVYLSPAYICVAFKKETGCTIMGYLNKIRVEKSLDYLSDKGMPINEIAERVGYENGNYYAKIFRKVKGMSPRQYREQIKEDY